MPITIRGKTYYKTQEACKLAGVSRSTFMRWLSENKITDVKHRDRNGWRLFTKVDVERLKTDADHIEVSETK